MNEIVNILENIIFEKIINVSRDGIDMAQIGGECLRMSVDV